MKHFVITVLLLMFVSAPVAHALTAADIELLISLGIIPQEKAAQARAIFSTNSVQSVLPPAVPAQALAEDKVSEIGEELVFIFGEFSNENKTDYSIASLCRSQKNALADLEEKYDVNIRCVSRVHSFTLQVDTRLVGVEDYCIDFAGVHTGKSKKKNGIVYCDYPGVSFEYIKSKTNELIDEIKAMKAKGYDSQYEASNIKGKTAAIKANMANSRAQAELYYDENTGLYDPVTRQPAGSLYDGVCTATNGIVSMVDAVKELSDKVSCYDYKDSWAFYAKLPGSEGQYCIDSAGAAGNFSIRRSGGKAYCVR